MPNWKTTISEEMARKKKEGALRLNVGDYDGEKRVPYGAKLKEGEPSVQASTEGFDDDKKAGAMKRRLAGL